MVQQKKRCEKCNKKDAVIIENKIYYCGDCKIIIKGISVFTNTKNLPSSLSASLPHASTIASGDSVCDF